jgi:hypothetical protein
VAGAGIVPGVRAFQSGLVELFKNLDGDLGVELFQDDAEGGAHDSRPDQDNIRFRNEGVSFLRHR